MTEAGVGVVTQTARSRRAKMEDRLKRRLSEVDLDLLQMIEIMSDVGPLKFSIAARETFFEFHAAYSDAT